MSRKRTCGKRCHSAKSNPKTCRCFCSGYFHGGSSGAVHRRELYDGVTKLEEHGFEKGKTKFIAQQALPMPPHSTPVLDGEGEDYTDGLS